MKRTFLPFLIICFVLLWPRARTSAQMQSLASPSSERKIANTSSFTPVKSLAISSDEIVTLCRYSNASIFGKTKDGTQNIDIAFTTDSIADFDFYQNTQAMVFCGSNSGIGFIGLENINILFSSNTIMNYRFDLPLISELQKVYFYEGGDSLKMALIGDGNSFIDFNLGNGSCTVYETPLNTLLDIAITNDYIAVLGMDSDTSFVIYAHEKTNTSHYMGLRFRTRRTRIDNNDIKYHLTALNSSSNHVMVAFSLENNRNEHCIIDLNSFNFSIVDDQVTLSDIGKPAIVDLEYEPTSNTVLCLTTDTGLGGDYVYRVKPCVSGIYTADGLVTKRAKRLYNLVDYGNDYFLALGMDMDSNLYFFDKNKFAINPTNCFIYKSCDLIVTTNMAHSMIVNYNLIYPMTIQPTTITFQHTTNVWDTICN